MRAKGADDCNPHAGYFTMTVADRSILTIKFRIDAPGRGGLFLQALRGFAKLSCLFVPNVGLHFDLLHNVLEASPFFWNHRYKLKAELLPSAPTNNRLLNPNWGFVLYRQNANIQRGSRLNVGGTPGAHFFPGQSLVSRSGAARFPDTWSRMPTPLV
jgi:hypothetical protein